MYVKNVLSFFTEIGHGKTLPQIYSMRCPHKAAVKKIDKSFDFKMVGTNIYLDSQLYKL